MPNDTIRSNDDDTQDIFTASDTQYLNVKVDNPEEEGMAHGKMGWIGNIFWSSAAERNRDCIGKALEKYIGSPDESNDSSSNNKLVLELGSGSGQHIVHFATLLPHLYFQPTEYPGHPNPKATTQQLDKILMSIDEMVKKKSMNNVKEAKFLDASKLIEVDWIKNESLSAIIAINVIHISPPEVLDGILSGAAKKLQNDGYLFFYGPFAKDGIIEPESNRKFHTILKEQHSSFGLRDIDIITKNASTIGLELIEEIYITSSNNYILCFRKSNP